MLAQGYKLLIKISFLYFFRFILVIRMEESSLFVKSSKPVCRFLQACSLLLISSVDTSGLPPKKTLNIRARQAAPSWCLVWNFSLE